MAVAALCSEGTNLGTDAGEKGVGSPMAKFHDGEDCFAIEFEGHSS